MAAAMQVVSPGDGTIKILKWKVKKDSMVMKGSILALYEAPNTKSQLKLKSTATGIVDEILVQAGSESPPGTVLATLRQQSSGGCTHPTVMKDMCADCGADLRREAEMTGDHKKTMSASVAMVHNIPELIVSQEQALELGREDEQRLLKTRKLVLLVDLDQTLIHTTNDNIPPKLKDVYHFQLGRGPHGCWYHMKLRPFTLKFLEKVSTMYEMHICTFGVRLYAHTVARLIDPDEKFFSHRILSRDECFDPLSKTANLKALFPCGDAMVCIIDDREDVWNRAPNLVHVKPYRFFQGTADINAPPGLEKRENDSVPIVHKVIDHHPTTPTTPADGGEEKGDMMMGDGQVKGEGKSTPVSGEGQGDGSGDGRGTSGEADGNKASDDPAAVPPANSVPEDIVNPNHAENKAIESKEEVPHQETQSVDQATTPSETESEPQPSSAPPSTEEERPDTNQPAGNDQEEEQREVTSRDQLAQDLSVSSDSDSDSNENAGESSSSNTGDREDKESSSVDGEDSKPLPMDTAVPESDSVSADKEPSSMETCVTVEISEDSEAVTVSGKSEGTGGQDSEASTGQNISASKEEEMKEISSNTETESHGDDKSTGTEDPAAPAGSKMGENDRADNDEEVEWDDNDDYLLHLEEILTRIYKAFYSMVDEGRRLSPSPSLCPDLNQGTKENPSDLSPGAKGKLPDLKSLIPYVKRKTLKGCNIVLSGLVPLNTSPDKSYAHFVAKSLGATIQQDVVSPKQAGRKGQVTTHLVAAKPGTIKHKSALRVRGVHIVHSAWLWACNERWEQCDERLFPLDADVSGGESSPAPHRHKKRRHLKHKRRGLQGGDGDGDGTGDDSDKGGKRRKTKESGGGGDADGQPLNSGSTFADSVHPLLAFSDEDLECMDKEVDELMAEDASGSEDENDDERDQRFRDTVLGSVSESGSSSDSLSGEFPRGWGLRRRSKSSPHASKDDLEKQQQKELEAETEDTENELVRFQKTVETFSPDSNSSQSSSADSIGSVDDEIAEAVEKEFLGSL